VWSFPEAPYDVTLAAMKALARKIAGITRSFTEYAHPLDVNRTLAPEYLKAAAETSRELRLTPPIPKLGTLGTGGPVHAALQHARSGTVSADSHGAGRASPEGVQILAGLHRALPERTIPAGFRTSVEGEGAHGVRAGAVHRAAHRARSGG